MDESYIDNIDDEVEEEEETIQEDSALAQYSKVELEWND